MRRPYASDAQERERSEPRLASHTSYNAVALIHASISEAWVIGNCLMELPLRSARVNAAGAAGLPYAGSTREQKQNALRTASAVSLWRLPSRNRATAKVERWEGLMLTAPRRPSRQATFDWLAPCRISLFGLRLSKLMTWRDISVGILYAL